MSASVAINPISPDVTIIRRHWVTVTGSGFIPNTGVAIYICDSSGTAPGLFCVTLPQTDGSGNLSGYMQIPNFGTPSGTYTLTACNAVQFADGTHRTVGATAIISVTIS